jgi:hypothetical protein
MQIKCFAVAAAFLLCAGGALAQLRIIPADAKRGEIRHLEGMVVEINGRRQQLAPGAQIRDASNLIIVPAALPPGSLVKYLLDANETVQRVWILTPQEAAQPDRQ